MLSHAQKQAFFTQAVKGLLSQGLRQSRMVLNPNRPDYKEDKCVYRGPDNRKCAIGWLIPDEKYRHVMETWTPREVIEAWLGGTVAEIDYRFFRGLQVAHDRCERSMAKNLVAFANNWNLKVPPALMEYL